MKVNQTTECIKNDLSGFLLIDKPVGPTSFNIVSKIRRALTPRVNTGEKKKRIKVGHAGTLDPLASGLLIIAVGKATKQIHQFVGLDKTYETEVTLGATTETDDAEGKPVATPNAIEPTKKEVQTVLQSFIGTQLQTPPIFSAKKQDGVRLYKLARQGKTTDIKQHQLTIFDIKLLQYEYPKLIMEVHCSSGTYIRSLARDIGKKLQTGGYVSKLKRTAIGKHHLISAIQPTEDKDELKNSLIDIKD